MKFETMSLTVDEIMTEALGLPSHTRAFVAEKLIESLDADSGPDLSDAWQEEIKKRCQELDKGMVELKDEEEVFAKAYAQLG